ncbi:hypothetical protein Actkin_01041 [Actinokineospora sp. UTMC 2448]|nr:hypothetical protein Actkin_01041 [Actinokineospora sp. UTMC 2448]
MCRKEANTGPFAGLPVPMQKRVVYQVAAAAGVGLAGVKITIDRNPDMIGSKFYGYTPPGGGQMVLYPDAFSSIEALAVTLGHERTHVSQVQLYGPCRSSDDLSRREDGAYATEYQWLDYLRGKF